MSIDPSLIQPGDLRATSIPGFDVIASWHSRVSRNPGPELLRALPGGRRETNDKEALSFFWPISGVRSRAAAVAINSSFDCGGQTQTFQASSQA
jgi:hypothetical protein